MIHIDHAAQQGGFERPVDGMDAKHCPRCGSTTISGFGLMGGGYGPYVVCSNDNEEATNIRCGWFYKEQTEPEQPAPSSEAIPDSVYSVIVRYVPVADGGPQHELLATCDRCGSESPVINDGYGSTVHGSDTRSREFVAWLVNHRRECKR